MTKPKAPLFLLLLACLLALAGCATPERCARLYPPMVETRTITLRDTTILTPAAETQWISLPCPPVLPANTPASGHTPGQAPSPVAGPGPGRTPLQVVRDTSGQAQLSYYTDAAGRLHLKCHCLPVPHTLRGALQTSQETRTVVRTEHVRGWWWWSGLVSWLLIGTSLIYALIKSRSRKW